MYFISYSWTHGEVLKLSSESRHLGLLFQLVGQLKQFVPNLPVSAAHKTLTFRLKQEDFPNLPVSSDHKNGLSVKKLAATDATAKNPMQATDATATPTDVLLGFVMRNPTCSHCSQNLQFGN